MSHSRGRGLQPGAPSMFDTVVTAVAGNAPAHSLAGTTAVPVGAVQVAGPGALPYRVLAVVLGGDRGGVRAQLPLPGVESAILVLFAALAWVPAGSPGDSGGTATAIGPGGLAAGPVPMSWYRRGGEHHRPERPDAARTVESGHDPGRRSPARVRDPEGSPTDSRGARDGTAPRL
ncbi:MULTISPECIES: hypothetical protein [unclassified Streptomyces]|uniref:hypothetical protein n=1 Tax=unclassified Streptomyces TaxID=2593676 RepID=UPI001F037B5F|nr:MULTISPECIES: hypothetical protein [unclassified Streptomyces]MCH0566535.1 hypothetical protein [Streptomyces sp. MUM 2J]MCH0571816.1 hypothetical protein [Streptomyces sp. MUM 136J]